MDSFNKIISFFLGLVVVIVFLAFATGRLKLPGQKTAFFGKPSPTPTPISSVKIEGKSNQVQVNNYQTQMGKTPKNIPATGVETLFFPTVISLALAGGYLRKMR